MSTTNGTAAGVTATAVRDDRPDRWVRLTLALRDSTDLGALAHSPSFVSAVEGLDELAAGYALENWESGLLSGAFFVGRRARQLPPRLSLSELVGRLGSEDMAGVVAASSVAVAHLLGVDPATVPTTGWRVVVSRPAPAVAAVP